MLSSWDNPSFSSYLSHCFCLLCLNYPIRDVEFGLKGGCLLDFFNAPILIFSVFINESLLSTICSLKLILSWTLKPSKVSVLDGVIISFPVFNVNCG